MKKIIENILVMLLFLCFASGIFFSSASLTGNAILNLDSENYTKIGYIFFMIGFIGTFIYLRMKYLER